MIEPCVVSQLCQCGWGVDPVSVPGEFWFQHGDNPEHVISFSEAALRDSERCAEGHPSVLEAWSLSVMAHVHEISPKERDR